MGPSGAGARLSRGAGALPLRLAALLAAFALAGCAHHHAAASRAELRLDPPAQEAAQPADPRAHRGVFHTVQAGETLYRIARSYGVTVEELVRENAIDDAAVIDEGRVVFVPGAPAAVEVPEPDSDLAPAEHRRKAGLGAIARASARPLDPAARGAALQWPVQGVLFSAFGARARDQHDGIDLAAPEGTPVLAAASGTVLFAGEQRGYGKIVLIAHQGDLVTVYAHNAVNLVESGARVERGEAIARIGHTGNATGPHLHFEVRVAARPHDPLGFLH